MDKRIGAKITSANRNFISWNSGLRIATGLVIGLETNYIQIYGVGGKKKTGGEE